MNSYLGKRQVIPINNNRYVTWSSGRHGPLIILLHGWPVSSHHWRFLIPALNLQGIKCLAIDLKGLGESTANDQQYEKKFLAKEIISIINRLHPKVRQYAIIGHDWGGSVAMAMAALRPHSVIHLVIEDEVPPGISAPLQGKSLQHYSSWHGHFHRTPELPEKLIESNKELYIDYFLNLRFRPSSLNLKDRKYYQKCYRGKKKTKSSLAYYRSFAKDARFFRKLLSKKPINSALAIYGEHGMGVSVAIALKQVCKNVEAFEIKRCGHYPAEEQPNRFNKIVLNYLKDFTNL